MYCTHWFNTIFAYSLPFEQLLRVWDVFLLEGMKVRHDSSVKLGQKLVKHGQLPLACSGSACGRLQCCCAHKVSCCTHLATVLTQPIVAATALL
jgi:hypothetical protein